jgi:carbon monoxide dehydrogenase subunit G
VRIEGERTFAAPPPAVFEALTDPELLAGMVPGVERVEVESADRWNATVASPLGRGPSLPLRFELHERRPPERAGLRAKGGRMGAKIAVATGFDLAEAPEGTRMRWSAEISLGGLLRALDGPGFEPVARRQAEKSLDRLAQRVESGSYSATNA